MDSTENQVPTSRNRYLFSRNGVYWRDGAAHSPSCDGHAEHRVVRIILATEIDYSLFALMIAASR
jgi:hypothetical protein